MSAEAPRHAPTASDSLGAMVTLDGEDFLTVEEAARLLLSLIHI